MSDDKKATTPRSAILHEAADLIDGARDLTYGTPTDNFANIAALWNIQFAHLLKPGAKFEARHIAEASIHTKMARNIADAKRDNWLDIAGYAGCGYETTLQPKLLPKREAEYYIRPPSTGSITYTSPPQQYTTNIQNCGTS